MADVPGETRRMAMALAASTSWMPTVPLEDGTAAPAIQWVVGGCRDAVTGEATFIVSNDIGTCFLPGKTGLPPYIALHVYADGQNIPWATGKIHWIGSPLYAVFSYANRTGRTIAAISGTALDIPQWASQQQDSSYVHFISIDDELPKDKPAGWRNRLEVVDPDAAHKVETLSLAALVEGLPLGTEPDPIRRAALWNKVVIARAISVEQQLRTWLDFCRDQHNASAWQATHSKDETTARACVSDNFYWGWNLRESIAALAALKEGQQQ